mmetsp:Transcript_74310/g.147650  ORF Transcript_74310/g.147650 Transcript_74310/m.147650 type:complete len:204 (+) Transcript_74310:208-819(+)
MLSGCSTTNTLRPIRSPADSIAALPPSLVTRFASGSSMFWKPRRISKSLVRLLFSKASASAFAPSSVILHPCIYKLFSLRRLPRLMATQKAEKPASATSQSLISNSSRRIALKTPSAKSVANGTNDASEMKCRLYMSPARSIRSRPGHSPRLSTSCSEANPTSVRPLFLNLMSRNCLQCLTALTRVMKPLSVSLLEEKSTVSR